MTFKEALEVLGIEDYAERIIASNSHGELFHLRQYFVLAEMFKKDAGWFRGWFEYVVKFAEDNSERPESIFQHIDTVLKEHLDDLRLHNQESK